VALVELDDSGIITSYSRNSCEKIAAV